MVSEERPGSGASHLSLLSRHGPPKAVTATCPVLSESCPLHTDFLHTSPLSPDIPRCVCIPAKATGIPFHNHRRVPVLFPHLHPNSCYCNPEVLHSQLGHHSGFSGPASRVEPLRSFTPRGTGTRSSPFPPAAAGTPSREARCVPSLTHLPRQFLWQRDADVAGSKHYCGHPPPPTPSLTELALTPDGRRSGQG